RRHPRLAGHLPRRAGRSAALRGPAARRLHRCPGGPRSRAMRLRALFFSLLLTTTVACAVGPRYKPPELPVPKAWQEAPAVESTASSAPLERWWTAFQDPILDRLVARALEGNLDLKIAAARIREARAARGIAAAAGLPQVDAQAAYSRTRRSDAVPPFKSASG